MSPELISEETGNTEYDKGFKLLKLDETNICRWDLHCFSRLFIQIKLRVSRIINNNYRTLSIRARVNDNAITLGPVSVTLGLGYLILN